MDVRLLRDIASEVRRKIKPLLGSREAWKPLGKGVGGDKTRLIDAVAEEAVFEKLREKALSCMVVSEERGLVSVGEGGDGYLIVDALDGTNNSLRGIPLYCVSLAAADKPKLSSIHSAVVQDLHHDETFWASKGEGARLEGSPITPSTVKTLEDALIGVDMNPPLPEGKIGGLIRLLRASKHSRHFGVKALELCYVASGRLDAFVEVRGRTRVTDLAASYLIIKEAGGLIVDERGENLEAPASTPRLRLSVIAAGNRRLLRQILSLLSG